MNNLDKNLQSLKAEFHDQGKAARGLNNLTDNFIKRGRKTELAHLLRYHDPIPVEGNELVARFEIDSLIEFYNLLLIAIFAGYVPGTLNEEMKEEMIGILDDVSVKQYYREHYPYLMAGYTLQYAQSDKHHEQPATVETITVFNQFVSLNRMLKNDTDLERFMGMLDFVGYNGDTIAEVNRILSSYEKLNEAFTAKVRTEAQHGVWGFIKYTAFISQFKELLIATDQYPLLQSAIWMYHGYYFDRIDSKMQDFLDEAFDNLEKAFSTPELFRTLATELLNNNEVEILDKDELEIFATSAIQQSREDVHFVLNRKWGNALKKYFAAPGVPSASKEFKWDVFISYSSKDAAFVRKLLPYLAAHQITYCLDDEQLQWGENLSEKIGEGVVNSRKVLLVVSADYLASQAFSDIQNMSDSDHKLLEEKSIALIVDRLRSPLNVSNSIDVQTANYEKELVDSISL